jgi:signal transduction histidine kinase
MSIIGKIRQHPTLNAILVVQIIGILVSSGVMIWSIQLSMQTDEKVKLQKYIAQIEHATEEGLSRWITWSILGMGAVIHSDIEKSLLDFGVRSLTITDTSLKKDIINYKREDTDSKQATGEQIHLKLSWEEMDTPYDISVTFLPVLPSSQYHVVKEHGFVILMVLIGILVLSLLATTCLFNSNIVRPMRALFNFIDKMNHTAPSDTDKLSSKEGEIRALSRYVISTIREVKNYEGQKSRLQLARQVAHDIRSPLMALKVCTSQLSQNPKEVKSLILDASNRIEQIANDLLSSTKSQKSSSYPPNSTFFIVEATSEILKEKEVEFKSLQPQLDLNLPSDCALLQIKLKESDFKRVLSNLINNAIEAVPSNIRPKVKVSVICEGKFLQVYVEDNGVGVSEDLFEKICEEGFSQNKESGNGIGLSFAKHFLQKNGGRMGFSKSSWGGLCVNLTFPSHLCSKSVALEGLNRVLIVDDDESVVRGLKGLLATKIPRIDTVVAKAPKAAFNEIDFEIYDRVFIDYDLRMEGFTGFDLVRERKLEGKALIITANYAELRNLPFAKDNNLPIFPKTLIQYLGH